VRSFDLFGTLCAGRNPAVRDGDQESHLPIAENVARVRRGDLVISDYYDAEKAQRILKEVCGLDNDLIVTHDGKAGGAVWQRLQACGQTPELHIGDDPLTDLASPLSHGVKAELAILATFTMLETEMQSRGFPGLARLMRESRLATWHEEKTFRDLQRFQSQVNLPFLFLASILVSRMAGNCKQILMSARDCYLWEYLFRTICHHCEIALDVKYFYTSRLTRYFPSDTYLRYLNELLSVPSLVVDLCGFGTSLKLAIRGRANILLLVGYENCVVPHLISGWMNEATNFAQHPMVADVEMGHPKIGCHTGEALWQPVTVNPLGVDWEAIPELQVMHKAFFQGVRAVREYDFSKDMEQSTEDVQAALVSIFGHMDDYVQALGTLTAFRVDEARATAALINARGCVEGVVV
jgi:hypothetical protein